MSNGIDLVTAILTIESSYLSNVERATSGVPDTAQVCFGANGAWRVRTYAIDHDIHPHLLWDSPDDERHSTDWAVEHFLKHYDDVLSKIVVMHFDDPSHVDEVARVLASHGLDGSLEVTPVGFTFYNPDRARYRTKSQPS